MMTWEVTLLKQIKLCDIMVDIGRTQTNDGAWGSEKRAKPHSDFKKNLYPSEATAQGGREVTSYPSISRAVILDSGGSWNNSILLSIQRRAIAHSEASNKRNPNLARNKNLQPDNAKAWRESDVTAGSQHGHMPDWLR